LEKTNNELLKDRIRRNYADFKSETLSLDEETIYSMSDKISAIEDTYYQMTEFDYLDESEAEYLLEFDNPLEMISDCLKEMRDDEPVEIDEALYMLFDLENHEEKYITAKFAEELRQKHGSGISLSVALLLETVEAEDRYLWLQKLSRDEGGSFCSDEE